MDGSGGVEKYEGLVMSAKILEMNYYICEDCEDKLFFNKSMTLHEAIKNLQNVVSLRWLPILNNSFGLFNVQVSSFICHIHDYTEIV